MTQVNEKEPLVPRFVDMGQSVLLAVAEGDSCTQRFIKDDEGKVTAPTGVYGLAFFSIEEIALKIRYMTRSDDPWLIKTGEFLQDALDRRLRLDHLGGKGTELVFCLVYRNPEGAERPCGFTLIPVNDTSHLSLLEADAIRNGDSYYCFLRQINDPCSFSVQDTRRFLIASGKGTYLRQFKDGGPRWTTRRNKAVRLTRTRAKAVLRRLKEKEPGTSFRMVQFIAKPQMK